MKKSYIILILFLGIFFIPSNSFACGSEKHTCEKEVSSNKTKEKSCCDNDTDDKGCEGSCGHSKCGCASTCISSSTSIILSFKSNTVFNFISLNKVNFFYKIPSILEGYSSIWLIPKIS
jgi:hypothetical protein